MDALDLLNRIHEDKPLVHHITNWVTIYDCANITRAFGALPVMAHAIEEVEEMTGLASALVLNIGTLTPSLIESMLTAGNAANKRGIPVILDAVGVGATRLRTDSAVRLIDEITVAVVKGNAGEIGVLSGVEAEVKGVELISVGGDPKTLASELASEIDATVVVTGEIDYVADKNRTFSVRNGHELMGKVVGTGCMAASVVGCFTGVESDYAVASSVALGLFGLACERAAKKTKLPGSFKSAVYDEVYSLTEKGVDGVRISED